MHAGLWTRRRAGRGQPVSRCRLTQAEATHRRRAVGVTLSRAVTSQWQGRWAFGPGRQPERLGGMLATVGPRFAQLDIGLQVDWSHWLN